MSQYADRVLETSTTTGTGDLTLDGAVTGYITINAAQGTNAFFAYSIVAVDGSGVPTGQWEVGLGYLSASTTMVRYLLYSSSTGSVVNFSAGTKRVFITLPATQITDKGRVFAQTQYLILP